MTRTLHRFCFALLAAASISWGSNLHAGETNFLTAPPEPVDCGIRADSNQLIRRDESEKEPSADTESIHLLIEALEPERQQALLNLLNRGSTEELIEIKGIAAGRAKTIISSRPFRSLDELLLLRGFGFSLAASVIRHEIRDGST